MIEYDCEGRSVWVTRASDATEWYYMTMRKPAGATEIACSSSGHIRTFCSHQFHRYTGLRLKPGESRRVRLLVVVEE